jgi:transcription termination/antitermination protein NusG
MTSNENNNGESDVSENFPTNSEPEGEESLESTQTDNGQQAVDEDREFEVDLGSDSFGGSGSGSDLDINLDFGAGSLIETDGDINLDFRTEEEEAAEAEQEEAAEDADAAEQAALEAFRSELRAKIGEWYVVHTYSGMENRVKQNLENRVSSLNMEDYIHEIVVPTEEVTEIRNGQRKTVKRTTLPGYVLVRMDLTDESWSTVRHTPSVTGFVGHSNNPVPLGLDEVEKMLAPAVVAAATANKEAPARKKKKVEVADFAPGDSVMVIDGPFAGVHATITEINANAQRIKALVEILGRETPVDLTFSQIQKV